jgi:uncharacterized protein YjiS (DUF1127 family)
MFDLMRQVADALLDAWRTRAALRELGLLSDRQLADLGLRREQLATLTRSVPQERKRKSAPPSFRAVPLPCG